MSYATHKKSSFLLGGLVGAGLALMTAPASGKETRRRISDFAEDIRGRAGCYIDRAKGKITYAVEKGKGIFQEKRSIFMKSFDAGKEAFKRERERYTKEHECVEC